MHDAPGPINRILSLAKMIKTQDPEIIKLVEMINTSANEANKALDDYYVATKPLTYVPISPPTYEPTNPLTEGIQTSQSGTGALYGIGDLVRIVKYGHLICINYSSSVPPGSEDIFPGLVGQEGIVDGIHTVQGITHYSIAGIEGKHSPYYESQMELIRTH